MRYALKRCAGYPANLARTVVTDWNAFWYTPADPAVLGMLRVLTGMMLFYSHTVWGLALDDFFGPASWLNARLVQTIQRDQYAYSFWWLVPSGWIGLAHGASLAVLAAFAVGIWTRLTSVLAFVVVVSYANRVPAALFGLDQICGLLTLYLAIGPSGQAFSLDRLLARWRNRDLAAQAAPSVRANVAQRLIQIHMCIIYFFAGITKLQGPSWWSGEAMWRAFANLEYQSTDMTWLAWFPWLLNLLTYVTIVWEMSFCVLVWKPIWRPLVLAGAVVLHVGIGACLGMWTFGLIMLVGCASFLPSEGVRRLAAALVPEHRRAAVACEREAEACLAAHPSR